MNKVIIDRVQIGITVYNEGSYLKEAWDTVVNQTDNRWNAIMVMDGGADKKTQKIFDSISHPSLKKIKLTKNYGPYHTRTIAIENTSMDWYCHLDADDLLPINMVKNIHQTIEKYPDIKYIIGHYLYFDKQKFQLKTHNGASDERLAYTLPFCGVAPIKKELFNKFGGYCKDLYRGGADWDFWVSVVESKAKGIYVDNILYERRVRNNSVGGNWIYQRHEVTEKVINRHPNYYNCDERRKLARYKAHELVARNYRSIGNRLQAYMHANKAIEFGKVTATLNEIDKEYNMSLPRYILRRFGRLIY